MSLRRFSGWSPGRATHHEYDEATGRLVRSVDWVESEWSPEQQGLMLALAEYEMSLCPGCGGDIAETYAAENTFAYKVGAPHRCHKCTALGKAANEYHAAAEKFRPGSAQMHAVRFHADLREGQPWGTGPSVSG